MHQIKRILLAGSTGYLGDYILKELINKKVQTRIIVRNKSKLGIDLQEQELVQMSKAELTNASAVTGCCDGIDTVISTVGITRQKDGLTYMDVDHQANINLLNEAKKSGVRKFIYVSALNGDKLRNLKIFEAKEKFVDELKQSGLEYCIVRPNGFFSDMTEFYNMAKQGTIYIFGDGSLRSNPIHGEDLAKECIKAIDSDVQEFEIGGPQTLTQNEIAEIAFQAVNKKPKVIHIPDWIRRLILKVGRYLMDEQKFGPIEFFMTVMAIEMVAPEYGKHTLASYYDELD